MKFASLLLGVALSALAVSANAACSMQGMDMKSSAKSMDQSVHKAQGKVDKVDKAAGKVTISHGPVASLKWSAMTMTFAVKDPSILDSVKPGSKVDFDIVKEHDGSFAISKATPAK